MDRLRLRTTLLIPLLLLCIGGTIASLLILRAIVQQQVAKTLAADLQHSVQTYENLARQRRKLLERETALLADLPSLKALMTGNDATILDGGREFWQVSGSDLFALLARDGRLVAAYNKGPVHERSEMRRMEKDLERSDGPVFVSLSGRLYEISVQPLLFGGQERESRLGFVVVGYEIEENLAREVSEASAAEVTFMAGDSVVVSTLKPSLSSQLGLQAARLLKEPAQDRKIRLGEDEYLLTAVPLGLETEGASAPQLIVLKSFAQASVLTRRVNEWVLTLALLAVLAGTGMLISISRTLTRPIESLVEGTRALAAGNFEYRLGEDGVQEIRELSRAFERMRVEMRRTQDELVEAERLATIGSMASSISHDLRHYLSAMYANAEFLSDGGLPALEREELFLEVKSAVQGMTELLDSLLLFTQTGRTLHPAVVSLAAITEHAMSLVRSHPAGRDVRMTASGPVPLEVWADAKKLGRAIYNLLLNACQAARLGCGTPEVAVILEQDADSVRIRVVDNGPGVRDAVRQTMFLPFVSEGKESGVGLGLTLALKIAQEHGGTLVLAETANGRTEFSMTMPRVAIGRLAMGEGTMPDGGCHPSAMMAGTAAFASLDRGNPERQSDEK